MRKIKQLTIDNANYQLIEVIGGGGSGVVWRAQSNGNKYAVKIINSNNSNKKERFKKEIEFCKSSQHKNIIKIIAEGEQNDKPCYVMPLYPHTLRDIIKNGKNADELIRFILKLCRAIKFIHNKNIFHRDIKPENILISNKDLVLADFGIAHFKDFKLTEKGDLLANRNYAAPEQKEKNNSNTITNAVDIFALGLIINECFTKQNPSGSDFKLISDSYPLYGDLDNLVANMIKQNPVDRLNIDTVITEIKFIHTKIKQNLTDIVKELKKKTVLPNIKKSVLQTIIKRASEDILFGEILFSLKSADDLKKYNSDWHMKIGYTVDDFLFNMYVQEQIHLLCKRKFEYESKYYRNDNWYNTLDLKNSTEHKLLYEQINNIVAKYRLSKSGEELLDLSGKILKYFSSCADYHCKEILENIEKKEEWANEHLKDAPIISIVQTLKKGIKLNIKYLLNGFDGLAGRYNFNFTEHIAINPQKTETYISNLDDKELLDCDHKKEEMQIEEILSEFQRKWNVFCVRINEDSYSIKFKNYMQYQKFREYALGLSKPYYIFEGDVKYIFKYPNFIGNIVELKLSKIFSIPDTLAKIVGLKEIDENQS